MNLFKLFFVFGIFQLTVSCVNDSTSDINNPTIVLNATYNQNIKSIINNNCTSCHNLPPENGAPMPLTTYEYVKQAVLERGLIDRISRSQGAEGMMPNGGTRLPQEKIDLIIQWRDQGFQN